MEAHGKELSPFEIVFLFLQKRKSTTVSLFSGSNSGLHDFGYTCYMPKNIVIDRLYIDDSNQNEDYKSMQSFQIFLILK